MIMQFPSAQEIKNQKFYVIIEADFSEAIFVKPES